MSLTRKTILGNRKTATLAFLVFTAGMVVTVHADWKAKIRVTTQSVPWTSETEVAIANAATMSTYVNVDTTMKYQTIDGFGGAFNEIGWECLNRISADARDSVIRALFDTVTGCKFNICRLPVGASDYARNYYPGGDTELPRPLNWYSLNENSNDTLMTKISIARDSAFLLQYIKAAMKYKPSLKIWGSPWSPPVWMKTNNSYEGSGGGHIMWTPTILSAYALYLEKAVQLYQGAGINFYALAFQNESIQEPIFPGCSWNQTQHHDFIEYYLGPKFAKDKVACELWTPTMNCGDSTYFQAMLGDTACAKYLTTVCYQYAGRDVLPLVNREYPKVKNYETETDAGDGQNTWAYAQSPTFSDMQFYFDNNTSAYMQWNMVLDPKGCSSWNWYQNAMITIDTIAKAVKYQGQYFAVKHFSYYVKPGAKKIKYSSNFTGQETFQNPDGSIIVVLSNTANSSTSLGITFGTKMISVALPAQSFATAVIYDSATTAIGPALSGVGTVAKPTSVALLRTKNGIFVSAGNGGSDFQLIGIDGCVRMENVLGKNGTGFIKTSPMPSGVYVLKGMVDGKKYASELFVNN